jgi:hypothetical protein
MGYHLHYHTLLKRENMSTDERPIVEVVPAKRGLRLLGWLRADQGVLVSFAHSSPSAAVFIVPTQVRSVEAVAASRPNTWNLLCNKERIAEFGTVDAANDAVEQLFQIIRDAEPAAAPKGSTSAFMRPLGYAVSFLIGIGAILVFAALSTPKQGQSVASTATPATSLPDFPAQPAAEAVATQPIGAPKDAAVPRDIAEALR